MKAFWDIAPRGLIGVDRHFRGAYFLYHKSDTLMMEAVRTSETSVYTNKITRRYIPWGSHFHTSRRESHKSKLFYERRIIIYENFKNWQRYSDYVLFSQCT
jgi:hypothetical protein